MTPRTRLLYLSNPNNPTGSVLPDGAMRRIVNRCETTGTWIVADEVYLGAEIDGPRTPSFWGMSDRVIVTSGLSKAYGIPGVRIGWIVGPRSARRRLLVAARLPDDRSEQAVGPPGADRGRAGNRERCYARTRAILAHNLPIAREWIARFGGRLTWQEPRAGAIALVRYDADVASVEIAERIRVNQSTLIVPGEHVGLEGYLRIWLGGREEFLREGLRRVGIELRQILD